MNKLGENTIVRQKIYTKRTLEIERGDLVKRVNAIDLCIKVLSHEIKELLSIIHEQNGKDRQDIGND